MQTQKNDPFDQKIPHAVSDRRLSNQPSEKTMKTIRNIILSIATATLGFAEGIPVDHETGKVTIPHTIITLSVEQIEETQALGTLTLNKEQERNLRVVSPQCPKRFPNVLPVTMRDCCCGIEGAYVIALSRDRVAVLHNTWSIETMRWDLFEDYSTHLHVNGRGEFYFEGLLIPFPILLKTFAAGPIEAKRNDKGKLVHSDSEDERFLYVELPVGAKATDAVYHDRLQQLAAIAEKIGLDHGW